MSDEDLRMACHVRSELFHVPPWEPLAGICAGFIVWGSLSWIPGPPANLPELHFQCQQDGGADESLRCVGDLWVLVLRETRLDDGY
jgi:hypothetical protein